MTYEGSLGVEDRKQGRIGTVFAKPLTVVHPTAGVDIGKVPAGASIDAAYFLDPSLLDQTLGTATVAEFQPTLVAADKKAVTVTVGHFSGYIVSWGRR